MSETRMCFRPIGTAASVPTWNGIRDLQNAGKGPVRARPVLVPIPSGDYGLTAALTTTGM